MKIENDYKRGIFQISPFSNFHSITLIGMRGDTFISLSYLDQIFSAKFLSKISKPFSEVKIDINWVDLPPLLSLIKRAPKWR